MLSPRFLRLYAEKCRHSAKSMNDPQSVAEFEVMAFDLEDWANDPAVSSPSRPAAKTSRSARSFDGKWGYQTLLSIFQLVALRRPSRVAPVTSMATRWPSLSRRKAGAVRARRVRRHPAAEISRMKPKPLSAAKNFAVPNSSTVA